MRRICRTARFDEVVATFGLVLGVVGVARIDVALAPLAVAGWITAAYWAISSTSCANRRALNDTVAGVARRRL